MKEPPQKLPDARGLRVLILRSAFNPRIVDGLLAGARSALVSMGVAKPAVTVEEVPGAFELPVAARAAAESGRFDAIVALGAVIRGETDHYEHIAREAAAGLAAVARETGMPRPSPAPRRARATRGRRRPWPPWPWSTSCAGWARAGAEGDPWASGRRPGSARCRCSTSGT